MSCGLLLSLDISRWKDKWTDISALENRFSRWKGIPYTPVSFTRRPFRLSVNDDCAERNRDVTWRPRRRARVQRRIERRCFVALITRSRDDGKKDETWHARIGAGRASPLLSRNFFAKLIIVQKRANVIQCAFTMLPTNWACLSATPSALAKVRRAKYGTT